MTVRRKREPMSEGKKNIIASLTTKKWSQPLRNWGQVYGEFSIMYEGRIPL